MCRVHCCKGNEQIYVRGMYNGRYTEGIRRTSDRYSRYRHRYSLESVRI